MSFAGYLTKLRTSGTPVVSTGNAMSTTAGSNLIYQISSTVREIFDRTVVPVVFSSAVDVSTGVADINYLFGKITFTSTVAPGGGPITTDLTYMPMTSVAGGHTYTLTQAMDVLDDTDFSSTGFRSKVMGLADVTLTISRWDTNDQEFIDRLLGSTTSINVGDPLVAEVNPGGSTFTARGWFVLGTENRSGDVGGLEASDLSMELDGDVASAFRWHDQ